MSQFFDDFIKQVLSYYDDFIVFLPKFCLAVLIVLMVFFTISKTQKKLVKYFEDKSKDKLIFNFVSSLVHTVNVLLCIFIFMNIIGFKGMANKIVGAAGLSAFVIGFAFKDIGENFLAGIILAFKRPFRLGDTIKSTNIEGVITEINLRETHVKTFDGKDVYIPNAQILKNPLFNYTIDGFLRQQFTIGVAYNSNLTRVIEIVDTILKQTAGVVQAPKGPSVSIGTLGESAVQIQVFYWTDTFNKNYSVSGIRTNLYMQIMEALGEENIELPGNIVELKVGNGQLIVDS